MKHADVLVVGSGPAGLAAAAHLAETGLRVVGVSPDAVTENPNASWPNTYGVWVDEVAPLGYAPFLAHVWNDVVGNFGRGEVALNRSYGRFDNPALREHFLGRGEKAGVVWQQGFATGVEHGKEGSSLTTTHDRKDGHTYSARLIIDSSGHFPKLVSRPSGKSSRNPAFQTAYGVLGRFSAPPVKPGQMLLMDFQDDFLRPDERATPTFLYAMDMGDGLFFVEETSLAHRPGLAMDVLKDRLERRLAHMGIQTVEVLEEENCRFPMNVPLPDLTQRTVGFGGAASMVHPAAGYLMASTLRRAPELASAISDALGQPDTSPEQAAAAAWATLWPKDRLRVRELYLFGLESLLTLDSTRTKEHFDAFFQLPPQLWHGYHSGTLRASGVIRTMAATFNYASNHVRAAHIRNSFGLKGVHLLRALR